MPWVCPWLMASRTGWNVWYGKWWKWPLINDKAFMLPSKPPPDYQNLRIRRSNIYNLHFFQWHKKCLLYCIVYYTVSFLFSWNWCALSPAKFEVVHRMVQTGAVWPWHGERKRKCHEVFLADMISLGSKSWDMSSWATTRIFWVLIFVKVRWLERVMQRENCFWRFRSFGTGNPRSIRFCIWVSCKKH